MAYRQETDKCKAIGMYRHIEWNTTDGVLIKTFETDEYGVHHISFEAGIHDKEYSQKIDNYRQFFLPRAEAARYMLKIGFNIMKVVKIFKLIDAKNVVWEQTK